MALKYVFDGGTFTRETRSASNLFARLKEPMIALGPEMPEQNKDFEKLAARTGLPLDSQELFLCATTKASMLGGSVFDPACVYIGPTFVAREQGGER